MRAQRVWGPGSKDANEALRRLAAVQAQELPYAKWSLGQRTKGAMRADLDQDFDKGRILRTHILRPTWHFVAPQDLRWLMRLSGPRVNGGNARRYRELGLDAETLARTNDVIANALADRHMTRRELAAVLARKRIDTEGQRMAYIMARAELDSVVCSGAMSGKQQTYALFDERVPAKMGPDGEAALAELARRYFITRGPATLKDFVWWSGLATRDARSAIASVERDLESFERDGRTYWFGEASSPQGSGARADLVQCYDETIIAYTESRKDVLAASGRLAAPMSVEGFMHAILHDGRALGRWRVATKRDGVSVETLIDRRLTAAERKAVDEAIDRYRTFMGTGSASRSS